MPQHAEDYSTTVIYKIRCLDENITDCYVGHTTRFDKRKFQHSNNIGKYDYKLYQVIEQNGGYVKGNTTFQGSTKDGRTIFLN
jgi:hypothetical protein